MDFMKTLATKKENKWPVPMQNARCPGNAAPGGSNVLINISVEIRSSKKILKKLTHKKPKPLRV